MAGPSVGTNLAPVVDWSTGFPFIDLFKQSRPWFTTTDDSLWNDTGQAGLLDLDAQGWIRGFSRDGQPPGFDSVTTILNTDGGHLREGLYVLDWKGAGELEVLGAQIVSRSDHRYVLDLSGATVVIRLHSTDPMDSGDYIRDIRFYHQDDADLLDAGLVFNPAFVDKIEDFRVLRFMEWMNTNGTSVREWSDATPFDAAQQSAYGDRTAGVSLDVMVALANETRTDPWFNIPHQASDAYVRAFVTYVRDHLAPGLVARFEYSNEVWNTAFEQGRWADAQAQAAWGPVEQGNMQWYGVRAAEVAHIVADVFGAETGTRALNVFATQAAWIGREQWALDAPAYVAHGGEPPRNAPFHVYSIQPYFGGALGSPEMADEVARWMTMGEAGLKAALDYIAKGDFPFSLANIGSLMAYHAGVAAGLPTGDEDERGWQLEGYEGGQHIVDRVTLPDGSTDPARGAFFEAVLNRPEMGQFYERYLETWRDLGGGLMVLYRDFDAAGGRASWGLWESAFSDETTRSEAVEAFRDGVAAWWEDGRPASAFVGVETRVDYGGTGSLSGGTGSDRLFGLSGSDRLNGWGAADSLYGGSGADTLTGGLADDLLRGGSGRDRIAGGAGRDAADYSERTAAVQVTLNDLGDGTARVGGVLEDSLSGIEDVRGGSAADRLTGNAAANRLGGSAGHDVLSGVGGADVLEGGMGNDRLDGGTGNDVLFGGTGADMLQGGLGRDVLYGGNDQARDVFVFTMRAHSPAGVGRDAVRDFVSGIDDIDLRIIDANPSTPLDDAFRWAGQTPGARSVWWAPSADGAILRVDVTGDLKADFELLLKGVPTLSGGDVLL